MDRPRDTRAHRHRSLGVSLIEALVALAVMGFGMLGVVAMQAAMRQNSDIAKQRSEATRLAQEAIESRRTFTAMNAAAGRLAWSELVPPGAEVIAGANATYTRTVAIPDLGSGRSKNIVVDVQWVDRSGATQSLRLATAVTGSLPELATSIGMPAWGGTPVRQPRGRHAAIPPAAVDQGNGTSRFDPPGSAPDALVRWVFDNQNGFITRTCTGTELVPVCVDANARLLAGYVRFATMAAQPLPADAESPPSPAQAVQMLVKRTWPAESLVVCFEEQTVNEVAYFCAVPVNSLAGNDWSGRAYVSSGIPLAGLGGIALDTTVAAHHRVCRYTPVRDCNPAVGATIWGEPGATAACAGAAPTPKRLMTNEEHPLDYANVKVPLVHQNYLVIRAGDGADTFDCPADNAATPLVNGNTWLHTPPN